MWVDLVFSQNSQDIKNLFVVVTSVLKKNTIIISLNNDCVICREFARYTKSISRGSIPIFPALLTIYLSYSSSSTRFIFYSDICPALLAMYVHFSNPSTGFIYFFPYISNVAIYLTSTRFIFIINRVSWKS